MNKNEIQQNEL